MRVADRGADGLVRRAPGIGRQHPGANRDRRGAVDPGSHTACTRGSSAAFPRFRGRSRRIADGDGDDRSSCGTGPRGVHSSSNSQSATTLGLAFRSRAASARSTAAYARRLRCASKEEAVVRAVFRDPCSPAWSVGPGGDDPDVAQQRSKRAQANGKTVPLFGRRPLHVRQLTSEVDPFDGIVVTRGFLKNSLRRVTRIREVIGL